METSEQINSVINNLAEKLQVPVDYVFQTMVKQASIQGITYAIFACISILIISAFIVFTVYIIKNESKYSSSDGEIIAGIFLVFAVFAILAFLEILFTTGDMITCFGNPEYWALNKIFSMIK